MSAFAALLRGHFEVEHEDDGAKGLVLRRCGALKRAVNRTAIGQVLVGADLFERQYGVAPARKVIACTRGDAALEWVCERRFIEVIVLGDDGTHKRRGWIPTYP